MAKKLTLFVCERFPSLKIVLNPNHTKEVAGRPVNVAGQYAQFEKNRSGVGEFRTGDQEIIDFLKTRPMFHSGIIYIAEKAPERDVAPRVRQGALGADADAADQHQAPAEKKAKGAAVRTPRKSKRTKSKGTKALATA